MVTYLLLLAWFGRRLPRPGPTRSLAGVVLLVLVLAPAPTTTGAAWPAARTALNAVATGPALAWGLLHGGQVHWHGGMLSVTGMRSGTGPRTGVMVGGALLTRESFQDIDGPLAAHELRHADQWAVLGPLVMPAAYGLAEVAGDLLTDCGEGGNVFEVGAGLRAGGYDGAAEVRCAGLLLTRPAGDGGEPRPRWVVDRAVPPALPIGPVSRQPDLRRRHRRRRRIPRAPARGHLVRGRRSRSRPGHRASR